MTIDPSGLPPLLRLDQVADHRYAGASGRTSERRNVVFGGQILAQMILASHQDRGGSGANAKEVKSIHAIFARAGEYTLPIEYEVDRMHDGRTLGSDTVTFSQQGRVNARGLVLWSKSEPDLIRHTANVAMPQVAGPNDPGGRPDEGRVFPGSVARIVGGVDTWSDDEPPREPVLQVWTRCDASFDDPVVSQAILSWATDGYLIGTAMLPYKDHSEVHAHRTISTGVISHTLSFHDRFDASEWLLLDYESVWAGRGRTHGRCNVWTEDGRFVATCTQDNLVRAFADSEDHTGEYQRIM